MVLYDKEDIDKTVKKVIKKAFDKYAKIQSNEIKNSPISYVPISYGEFLFEVVSMPEVLIRSPFQVLHGFVMDNAKLDESEEEKKDPDSIGFWNWDLSSIFVDGSDNPFFADKIFTNRLINLVQALRRGAQQNKIYIFKGPPGCGKSTMLTNLLTKYQEYCNSIRGMRYETVWKFLAKDIESGKSASGYEQMLREISKDGPSTAPNEYRVDENGMVEWGCPSHDNPILMVPRRHRRSFFDDLFKNNEFKWKLSTEKEYGWVFNDDCCTFCRTLYDSLMEKYSDPHKVFDYIYARPFRHNQRIGEGVTVFNPSDKPLRHEIISDPYIQRGINALLQDPNKVKYIYSNYALTNNGVYALQDIKGHNTGRLTELHNIISEGVHKVEDIEERVNSLLLAVMNPEDKKNIKEFLSFLDRVEFITFNYVLDYPVEVKIYREIFGKHIDERFLPRVLHNFARIIISTRLKAISAAMSEWIEDPAKYKYKTDEALLLLKMEIYATKKNPPSWLDPEDKKMLTKPMRRKIIAESEHEGEDGISGRDSIKIFNQLYSTYKNGRLVTMGDLIKFIEGLPDEFTSKIPPGFLDSLLRLYDYSILQEVKESLYFYNESNVDRDIKKWIHAINCERGHEVDCPYTNEKYILTLEILEKIEDNFVPRKSMSPDEWNNAKIEFRASHAKRYTTKTLAQDIMLERMKIEETEQYKELHEAYTYNAKGNVLRPFINNENFRNAIKDFGDDEKYKTYDRKIRDDVEFMIDNLCKEFKYIEQSAKEICIYVIDEKLVEKFQNE